MCWSIWMIHRETRSCVNPSFTLAASDKQDQRWWGPQSSNCFYWWKTTTGSTKLPLISSLWPILLCSQWGDHPVAKFKAERRYPARLLDAQTSPQFDARVEQSSRDEPWCESLKAALSQYREDSASKSWAQSWSQFTLLAQFVAISWLSGRFGWSWSEATTHFMD